MSVLGRLMPRSVDRYMQATMFKQQQTETPSSPSRRDALHSPDTRHELRQRAHLSPKVIERNAYTSFAMRSAPTKTVLIGGALLAAWALVRKPGQQTWHA
jgi:hypothetical protein